MTTPRIDNAPAFEAVFREHYAALARFAFRFVRDASMAEDIVQEVFGRLWTDRHSLTITTSLRAYLYAAVRNRALNISKHAAVITTFELDESDAESIAAAPSQPDELLDIAELHARLAEAFDALPEKQATVMRLRWRDELTYAEIAEVVGISIKGVEKHLSRGLATLRARLGETR
jgi:RNA polymerase sigma-70 factor (ECF subfamily)